MNLIIGHGQIGQALERILPDTICIDKGESSNVRKCVMHICFPYSKDFIKEVKKYIKTYQPKLVVIHSTVSIGTSDKLGAVYSPCRGVHPNLERGIRTFIKYFAGRGAKKVADIFHKCGIRTKVCKNTRDLEAGKLLDTTYYGWNIVFEKYIYEFCQKNKLDFDVVYREMNETYNNGYTELEMGHVVRPVLKHMDGEIGGHCVLNNCLILKDFIPAKIILNK
jgi:hypothetical protein